MRAAGLVEGLIGSESGAKGIALIALVGLAYGMLHALGPGHQKTLMAGIFVSEGGDASQVIKAAGAAALGHAVSVLGIFGALAAVGGSLTLAGVDRAGEIIARISGIALSAFALFNLITRIRSAAARARVSPGGHEHAHDDACCHGHGHGHVHSDASHGGNRATKPSSLKSSLTLLLGSLVPCPGAAFFLLAGFAAGRPEAGIVAVLAISLGMWLTLIGIGLLAAGTSKLGMAGKDRRWTGLVRAVFEIGGATLVLAFAVTLTL